jgi:hypothetical protein
LALSEESLVLLLSLEEGILERVGVCIGRGQYNVAADGGKRDLLSGLAKRMARVTPSGSPSLTSAAAFQTQLRSEPTLGDSFISGTTSEIGQRTFKSDAYAPVRG